MTDPRTQQTVPALATDADLLAAFAGRVVADPGRPGRLPEEPAARRRLGRESAERMAEKPRRSAVVGTRH